MRGGRRRQGAGRDGSRARLLRSLFGSGALPVRAGSGLVLGRRRRDQRARPSRSRPGRRPCSPDATLDLNALTLGQRLVDPRRRRREAGRAAALRAHALLRADRESRSGGSTSNPLLDVLRSRYLQRQLDRWRRWRRRARAARRQRRARLVAVPQPRRDRDCARCRPPAAADRCRKTPKPQAAPGRSAHSRRADAPGGSAPDRRPARAPAAGHSAAGPGDAGSARRGAPGSRARWCRRPATPAARTPTGRSIPRASEAEPSRSLSFGAPRRRAPPSGRRARRAAARRRDWRRCARASIRSISAPSGDAGLRRHALQLRPVLILERHAGGVALQHDRALSDHRRGRRSGSRLVVAGRSRRCAVEPLLVEARASRVFAFSAAVRPCASAVRRGGALLRRRGACACGPGEG